MGKLHPRYRGLFLVSHPPSFFSPFFEDLPPLSPLSTPPLIKRYLATSRSPPPLNWHSIDLLSSIAFLSCSPFSLRGVPLLFHFAAPPSFSFIPPGFLGLSLSNWSISSLFSPGATVSRSRFQFVAAPLPHWIMPTPRALSDSFPPHEGWWVLDRLAPGD